MKIKVPLLIVALFAAVSTFSHAFTLDAVGYEGGELSLNPLTVSVPGYGELIFETAVDAPLVINSGYENNKDGSVPLLSFNQDEAIRITFNGANLSNVDFYFTRPSGAEKFEIRSPTRSDLPSPQAFLITPKGSGEGTDLDAITWNTLSVPEAGSALLGILGTAGFVLRRRR